MEEEGCIQESYDSGLTWSKRLLTKIGKPQEVPTLHQVIGPDGKKRIIM